MDVITGIIKANFPARISFHVTSKWIRGRFSTLTAPSSCLEKETCSDAARSTNNENSRRFHYREEIRTVTEFVKTQGSPDYAILEAYRTFWANDDELFRTGRTLPEGVEIAEMSGEVSISSIQRRLKIGYNRAARIMELMEEDDWSVLRKARESREIS